MSVRDRSTREVSQAKEELLVLKSHTKTKADGIMHIISITCVVNSYSALQQEVKCVEVNLHRAQEELQVLQHYKVRFILVFTYSFIYQICTGEGVPN